MGHRIRRWLGARAGVIRGSVQTKLMVGFLAALAVVITAAILLDTRMTRSALQQQAKDTLNGELAVLRATFNERQSQIVTGLRNASQVLAFQDLLEGRSRSNLINELSPLQRNLRLDTVAVILPSGEVLVGLGAALPDLPPAAVQDLAEGPAHHLVPTVDGRYVQLGAVPIGDATETGVLVGGFMFDDSSAFQLRLLGGNDVLLVADGQLVGSTLADRLATPPAFELEDGEPATIDLAGAETFVDYAPLFAASGPWEVEGAVGVAIPEPLAQLDRALVRNRMLGVALIVLVVLLVGLYVERLFARPLLRLAGTARRIASGDEDVSFRSSAGDEIGLLAGTLEQMRRATLEQLDVIRAQAEELRMASERIVSAEDEERRRIANDLHDGLQRQLVLLRTRLGLYRQLRTEDPETAEAILAELEDDAESALSGLRETSQRIFPAILNDRGLHGGLNSLAGRAPVSVELVTDPDPLPRIDERIEINAYLLASEAMTNAVKHAQADNVRITVQLHDDALILDVEDDGVGFDPHTIDSDGGLRHLRDRVAAVGGRLDVASRPGEGTVVRALLPLVDALHPRWSGVTFGDLVSPETVAGRTGPPPHAG